MPFEIKDEKGTENRNRQKRSELLAIYTNDKKPIVQLQQVLKDSVFRLMRADSFERSIRRYGRSFYVPAAMMATPEEDAKLAAGNV